MNEGARRAGLSVKDPPDAELESEVSQVLRSIRPETLELVSLDNGLRSRMEAGRMVIKIFLSCNLKRGCVSAYTNGLYTVEILANTAGSIDTVGVIVLTSPYCPISVITAYGVQAIQ